MRSREFGMMSSRQTLRILPILIALCTIETLIAGGFEVVLGEPRPVPDAQPSVPVYRWFPDGHITILSHANQLQMYWAGASSFR